MGLMAHVQGKEERSALMAMKGGGCPVISPGRTVPVRAGGLQPVESDPQAGNFKNIVAIYNKNILSWNHYFVVPMLVLLLKARVPYSRILRGALQSRTGLLKGSPVRMPRNFMSLDILAVLAYITILK